MHGMPIRPAICTVELIKRSCHTEAGFLHLNNRMNVPLNLNKKCTQILRFVKDTPVLALKIMACISGHHVMDMLKIAILFTLPYQGHIRYL